MDDGDHPCDSIVIDLYSYEMVDDYDHVLVIERVGSLRGPVPFAGVTSSAWIERLSGAPAE